MSSIISYYSVSYLTQHISGRILSTDEGRRSETW